MNQRDAENLDTLRRSIPESSVQAAIRDWFVMHGAVVIRLNSGVLPTPDGQRRFIACAWHAPGHQRETAGAPDLLVMYRGTPFAIEVKRAGERQRPAQIEFQAAWEAAGGWYMVASSLDDVIREVGG